MEPSFKPAISLKLAALLAIAAALAFLPRLVFNAIQPTDVGHHVMWAQHFVGQLLHGDLVPRWLYGMQGGMGSPIFYYYPPLPYYAAALFSPLLKLEPQGWYLVFGSAWLALALSTITAYLCLRRHLPPQGAIWGALFYLLLPYHLMIDLHFRFALGELWAFVWLPLLMWEAEMIVAGRRKGHVGFALATAGLALSHVPSLVLCLPLFVAYCFFAAPKERRIRRFCESVISALVGMGIAGYFLVPAYLLQSQIHLELGQEGHFHFTNHFLFLFNVPPEVRLFVYPLNVLILFMLVIAGITYYQQRKNKTATRASHALMILIVVSFLMMTPLATPIWQLLPILQNTQFPWRFAVPLCIFTTMLFAISANLKSLKLYAVTFAILAAIPPLAMLIEGYYAPPLTMINPGNRIALHYSIEPTKETLPRAVDAEKFWPSSTMKHIIESDMLVFGPDRKQAEAEQGKDGSVTLRTHCSKPCNMVLRSFYFPGWTAENTENGNAIQLKAFPVTGQITLTAPHGENHIKIYRKTTSEEKIGAAVSIISLLMLIGYWWALRRQVRKLAP